MKLGQYLDSQLLEIKPSLGDGHCLLYSICTAYNNQLAYLNSICKSSLISTIYEEVSGNTGTYLEFYTKPRSEFFDEFNNYIKHKRYNSDIGDVIPCVIANGLGIVINILNEDHNGNYELRDVQPLETTRIGSIYIHRKGDHYNGIVYRSTRFTQVSPPKEPPVVLADPSPVVTPIVLKTAFGAASPSHARSSGTSSAAPCPHLMVSSPAHSSYQRWFGPPYGSSSTILGPPPEESSHPPIAHVRRHGTSSGPSLVARPQSTISSTFPVSSHERGSSNAAQRSCFRGGTRLCYSIEQLNSYRDSLVSKQCNRDVRKRLFHLHLWISTRDRLPIKRASTCRVDKSAISLHPSRNYASFSLINARSVCNKITYLRDYIDSRDLDIIGFVETWLVKDNMADVTLLTKPGYEMVHFPRLDRRGGGVGIMYKSTFSHISTKQIISEAFEGLKVILKHPDGNTIRVVIIYRPPASPIDALLDDLSNVLLDSSSHKDETIIAGDFNIHCNQRSRDFGDVMDLLETNGYKQHVTQSTHVSGNTLDLVITPIMSDLIIGSVRTAALISDHYAVECGLGCTKPPVLKQKLHYRKLKSINNDLFTHDLQRKLSTANDIDSYNSAGSSVLDSHAPEISSMLVLRKHKPWYNATLRHEKQKLRRLERKRARITDSKLRVAVQQYSTLLRTTRNSYYKNVLRDADCKAVHNIAAELMGEHTAMPRPECSDYAELATKFSSYFKDKISDIHKSLPPPQDIVHLPSVHQMADLVHITPAEVERSLKTSKIKTCALDPLPASLVKDNIHVVSGPISRIINKSIATATVPSNLKHSVITPIYKKKQLDVNKLSSYRPIAQLPVVAKVLERHV